MNIDVNTFLSIISLLLGIVCGFGFAATLEKVRKSVAAEKRLKEIINNKPKLKLRLTDNYNIYISDNEVEKLNKIESELLKEVKNINEVELRKYLIELLRNNTFKGKQRYLHDFFSSL